MDKLIIKKETFRMDGSTVIRISNKANVMLEDIVRRTGKSKANIANLLIEFAYDRVEVRSENTDENETEDEEVKS